MAEPVIAVFLDPDAPIDPIKTLCKTVPQPTGGTSLVMDCTKVEPTDLGLLRLVPKPENIGGATMGVFVHPSYVLFMLQGEIPKKMGF